MGCTWFHPSCAEVDTVPQEEEDWYCSQVCRDCPEYRYCHCHRRTGNEDAMVECEAAERCRHHEWYHMECVGLRSEELPGNFFLFADQNKSFMKFFVSDVWFCSDDCRSDPSDSVDHIAEYSKAILYQGLRHRVFRSAIRQGNGIVIMQHWRLNIMDFWNKRHPKYMILAHNMLIGMLKRSNGVYTDAQAARCAELSGGHFQGVGVMFRPKHR
ncbi:hypothetical protein CAPTEDRAFT_186661 [Capitella teleta]|uniref:Zinc finger PHD-type domain-containing protein n=1 Tax=Capitella teleta TaxID=283909 RepID=R7TQU7_CAPTE|nr:hypothetical protein CAPTEDRAFT_186661 [Capitella teleta]|eukprot:ELT95942.1 hypothetical protein CAPTEDRAFT_186661 [Capitella teleta]